MTMTNHSTGAVLFTVNLHAIARFYEQVAGMRVLRTEADHIRLELGSFRLTVHQIPERYAKNIVIKVPPVVREMTAIKLAFQVESISRSRALASELGGSVYGPDREWKYEGMTVCDGYDSDGNVFQLFQGALNPAGS
jgi:predicted enzyme related to lactoylglutathione lyase